LPFGFLLLFLLYVFLRGKLAEWPVWMGLLVAALAFAWKMGIKNPLANPDYPASTILHHISYFSRISMGSEGNDVVLLFGVSIAMVCLWAHRQACQRSARDPSARFNDILDALLLAALCFYAFAYFHLQYGMLLVPLVLLRLHRFGDGKGAHALQLVGFFLFLFLFKNGSTTSWLFAPIAPRVIYSSPGPLEAMPGLFADPPWGAIGRTLIAIGSVWLAYDVFRRRRESEGAESDPVPPIVGGRKLLAAAFLLWPLGLGFVLYAGLSSATTIEQGAKFVAQDDWSPEAPFRFVQFHTERGVPDALEVDPPTATRWIEGVGMRVEARRIDAVGRNAEPTTSILSQEKLMPNDRGTISIDLRGLDLRAGGRYRLEFSQARTGPVPPTWVQPVVKAEPGELIPHAISLARARFFGRNRIGKPWIAVWASLLVVGGACLAWGRFSSRSA